MNAIGTFDLSAKQVALVKHTIASNCNEPEFNLFMEAARSYGLDPFRKQIIPLVFGKKSRDQSKRRMSIVVTRDGLRVIAQRCKNYRPASEPAKLTYDKKLIGPTNPKGIVKATIYLWQQDSRGEWFKVMGEAYWDEFAPLSYPADQWDTYETGDVYEDSGRQVKAKRLKPGATQVLDDSGNWPKMPIVMIVKCAEVAALRAGWPDQFSGLYAEEEMEKSRILDLTASEIVLQEELETRLRRIGAHNAITVTWGDGWALENVPLGEFADRAADFIAQNDKATVQRWAEANRAGLQQFWAKSPGDSLAIKKLIEAKRDQPETITVRPGLVQPVAARP